MFHFDKGIKLNGSSLWLDAQKSVDVCCVSHGHMDHAKKHRRILASPPTIQFFNTRIGKSNALPLEFKRALEFEGFKITLYPAGHIMGSSQILVEVDGCRLLYSGDFNLNNSATAEPIEIPQSDILIMECTYGQPFYRFPDRRLVEEQLLEFVEGTLHAGATPVVIGYALGKAQEAMKVLGDAGYPMSVHGSVARLARIYEQFGVRFGSWEKYKKDELDGKVLIIPPRAARTRMVKRLTQKRLVFLSGWALHPETKYRRGVDLALPLSDHSDFEGLVDYARRTGARKVYTTHGFTDFANHLRRLGLDAEPLRSQSQLSLF
ncbi:MAG TPA: MBL fold metallo-hydrolase [bacterium]